MWGRTNRTKFKYLGVLFMSEGRMDWDFDGQIGAAATVKQAQRCSEEKAEPEGTRKGLYLPAGTGTPWEPPACAGKC